MKTEKSLFEQMGGTYTEVNGYLIPNLILSPEEERFFIGRYGKLHGKYLKEHKRFVYTNLLTIGKLNAYLHDIDEQAQNMLETLMKQMAKAQGITERLKANDQMEWVGRMNNIKAYAEEIVLSELIYN